MQAKKIKFNLGCIWDEGEAERYVEESYNDGFLLDDKRYQSSIK